MQPGDGAATVRGEKGEPMAAFRESLRAYPSLRLLWRVYKAIAMSVVLLRISSAALAVMLTLGAVTGTSLTSFDHFRSKSFESGYCGYSSLSAPDTFGAPL